MHEQPTVTVTVEPDGSFTIEVEGVKGSSCTSLTAALEKALGPVEKRTLTGEYYEKARETKLSQKLGGG